MPPRHRSRRPRRRKQNEEDVVDKLRLEALKTEFPHEVTQICNLAPLQAKSDLIDDFLLKVEMIVGLGRRRMDTDQKGRVIESIRATKAAADKIPAIVVALGNMDAGRIGQILSIAAELFPGPFFKNQDPRAIFRLLRDFRNLLLTLHAAIQLGTAIVDRPRRRGRPPSPYLQPVLELMETWEVFTAEQHVWGEDVPVWVVKPVPTPKKLDANDRKVLTKQPSTEFIRIALRMINPAIKDAEVFTAIKNALSLRDDIYEFIKTRMPKTFVGRLEAFDRFKTRRSGVRKRSA